MFAEEMLIPNSQLITSLSLATDLLNSKIVNHQKRVAYIAYRIAHLHGLTKSQQIKILISGLLHDIGAAPLNTDQRLELFKFNFDAPLNKHQKIGYYILKDFAPFKDIANIVHNHHAKWEIDKDKVHPFCHYIHLADRIDTLIDPKKYILYQVDNIKSKIKENSGNMFSPELVEVFFNLAEQESFWLDVSSEYYNTILNKELTLSDRSEFNVKNLLSFANMISKVIDFRSPFTATHSVGVACTAEKLSNILGFSKDDCKLMHVAGLLHDLGKLAVPIEILNKPGSLTDDEMKIMKSHTFYSYRIISKMSNFNEIAKWAAFHHEKLDGSGYPFRIKKEQLPMPARIIAVADIFTALREDRPYRIGLAKERVVSILNEMSNKALDERIVSTLIDNYELIEQICLTEQNKRKQNYKIIQKSINQ